jgi:hypothetical protein
MYTISDNEFIGLEDVEKQRGLIEFKTQDVELLKLEMEEIKPKLKTNNQQIIIRDGRSNRSGKNTKLF